MPNFRRIFAFFGAVSLIVSSSMLWTGAHHAFSDTSKVAPGNKFVLPPPYGTEMMHSQMRGKALFRYYCATCHGQSGNSDGFNTYSLKKPPPKLNSAKFMQSLSDETMIRAIKDGGPGVGLSNQMPHWKSVLSDQNIADLIHFIRTLAQGG